MNVADRSDSINTNIKLWIKNNSRFFSSLEEEEISQFLCFCELWKMDESELLWSEGDDDNYAAFILSGKVGIKKKTEFGDQQVIVGTYNSGTVIGELCLLTENRRTVTALALESVSLLILSNKGLENLTCTHPMLGLKLLKYIFILTCRRLNQSYDRMASIF